MDKVKDIKDIKKWPLPLPKLDTASRSRSSSQNRSRHVRDHGRRRSRTRDAIAQSQSPFDYKPLIRAALESTTFGSSRATTAHNSPSTVQVDESSVITQAQVDRERAKRAAREKEIGSSLHTLLTQAHDATRRLDDTYYELQVQQARLQSLSAALKTLYTSTVTDHKQFSAQADESSAALDAVIHKFDDLKARRDAIEQLSTRFQSGKTRSRELEARLDDVGTRLTAWERREKDGQRTRSTRWKATGGSVVLAALLLIGLLMWTRIHAVRKMQNDHHHSAGIKLSVNGDGDDDDARYAAKLGAFDEL